MKYKYTARNPNGQSVGGVIDAPDEQTAAKILHNQKLFVVNLTKEGGGPLPSLPVAKTSIFSGRVGLKDKIIFTQQLAMMIRSGLPLVDAFVALQEQTENKYFAGAIGEIIQDVRGGKTLSASIRKYPNIFSKFYVAIVASGEKSGKLDEVMERLSQELQKDYDLISKIKAAVTYPILIIGALIGIVILMLIFVIPEVKKIFTDMGVELPLVTRIILGASDIMIKYWYIFLIVFIGLIVGMRFYAKTNTGGLLWDKFKLRIPLVGKLIKKIYMSRFCRTTGTLVASGLPILNIIDTTADIIGNRVYHDALKEISSEVESGMTFSEAIKSQKQFPAMIYHLINVGEKSGKLDYTLLSMADFFDREIETTTQNLTSLVEPILIIIVGGGVGLVVAAVIMPMYSLVNVI